MCERGCVAEDIPVLQTLTDRLSDAGSHPVRGAAAMLFEVQETVHEHTTLFEKCNAQVASWRVAPGTERKTVG
jgi:hypothetical protein